MSIGPVDVSRLCHHRQRWRRGSATDPRGQLGVAPVVRVRARAHGAVGVARAAVHDAAGKALVGCRVDSGHLYAKPSRKVHLFIREKKRMSSGKTCD